MKKERRESIRSDLCNNLPETTGWACNLSPTVNGFRSQRNKAFLVIFLPVKVVGSSVVGQMHSPPHPLSSVPTKSHPVSQSIAKQGSSVTGATQSQV